ncbi:hypothetical protein, partial [Paracoccus sp. SCN 68-21]
EASKLHLDHTPRWPPEITPNVPVKLHHVRGHYPYFDEIIVNPDAYGFTNVTEPCREGGYGPATSICHLPDTYFYYWVAHPSDAAHKRVADRLYEDALALRDGARKGAGH